MEAAVLIPSKPHLVQIRTCVNQTRSGLKLPTSQRSRRRRRRRCRRRCRRCRRHLLHNNCVDREHKYLFK